jgi:hypothetical protein
MSQEIFPKPRGLVCGDLGGTIAEFRLPIPFWTQAQDRCLTSLQQDLQS